MTKEQRGYVAEHLRNLIAYDETEHEESDLPAFRAALAILADEAEADRKLGAAVRGVLAVTGHDAASLAAAEGEPSRAGLADFVFRLAVVLREQEASNDTP